MASKIDLGWFQNNVEVIDSNGKTAEIMIPIVKKYKVYKDTKGKYFMYQGNKIYSEYL